MGKLQQVVGVGIFSQVWYNFHMLCKANGIFTECGVNLIVFSPLRLHAY